MEFKEYQQLSTKAVPMRGTTKEALSYATIGLTEEAGEVAGLIKHKYYCGDEVTIEQIAEELGDVLWYISALCTELEIDLDIVAELNVAKLKARYADGEYSDEAVRNRHENFAKFSESEQYKQLIAKLRR